MSDDPILRVFPGGADDPFAGRLLFLLDVARLRVLRYVLCVVCDAPVVDINVGIGFEIVLLATCCVESFGVSVSSVSVLYCDGDACVVAVCDAV